MSDTPNNPIKQIAAISPNTSLSTGTAISAMALQMAIQYCDVTVIKDGVLYQQLRMENKEILPLELQRVLEIAAQFEPHMLTRGSLIDQAIVGVAADLLEQVVQEKGSAAKDPLAEALAVEPEAIDYARLPKDKIFTKNDSLYIDGVVESRSESEDGKAGELILWYDLAEQKLYQTLHYKPVELESELLVEASAGKLVRAYFAFSDTANPNKPILYHLEDLSDMPLGARLLNMKEERDLLKGTFKLQAGAMYAFDGYYLGFDEDISGVKVRIPEVGDALFRIDGDVDMSVIEERCALRFICNTDYVDDDLVLFVTMINKRP